MRELIDKIPPYMKEALQYAKDHGLTQFSEMERLQQTSQHPKKKKFDEFAELSIKQGELHTRTAVFMGIVHLIKQSPKAGPVPNQAIFDTARNITQLAMVDYNLDQRAQFYAKLGFTGQMAATFSTFKHGYLGQQVFLAKQKNPKAFLYHFGFLVGVSGVIGIPGFEETDDLVYTLTNFLAGLHIKGKPIMEDPIDMREWLMKNLPVAMTVGPLSDLTGVYIAPKFNMGRVTPEGILNATPGPSILWRMLQPMVEAMFNLYGGSAGSQDVKNVTKGLTPRVGKFWFDGQFNRQGNKLIGKDGEVHDELKDFEWAVRNWFAAKSTTEALRQDVRHQNITNVLSRERAKANAIRAAVRLARQGNLSAVQLQRHLRAYAKAGGDGDQFVESFKVHLERGYLPPDLRRAGKASTPASADRARQLLDNPFR
jgi:hypothetical protein